MYQYRLLEEKSQHALMARVDDWASHGWRVIGYSVFDTGASSYYSVMIEKPLTESKGVKL